MVSGTRACVAFFSLFGQVCGHSVPEPLKMQICNRFIRVLGGKSHMISCSTVQHLHLTGQSGCCCCKLKKREENMQTVADMVQHWRLMYAEHTDSSRTMKSIYLTLGFYHGPEFVTQRFVVVSFLCICVV